VVYDISPVVHFGRDTSIAIAALMLMENAFNLIAFMLVLNNTAADCPEMIVKYGACHPINLQQKGEIIF
jgi:hypothetical protein